MMLSKQRQEKVQRKRWVKNSVDVLVSGGIDSTALIAFYQGQKFSVRGLFVNFGQPTARQEAHASKRVCRHYSVPLSIITVKCAATFSPGEILGRNAFLLFVAILACETRPGMIAIGIHKGSPYYDCSEGFVRSIQAVVDGYTAGGIRVATPFLTWDKHVIWEFCKKARVPVDSTYSCERGGKSPCGTCLSCKDREALDAL